MCEDKEKVTPASDLLCRRQALMESGTYSIRNQNHPLGFLPDDYQ